jgi:lipopolysaccharide biosynthesis protein
VFKQATGDLHYHLSGIHQHRRHLSSLKLHLFHGKKVPQRKQWVNNCWLVVSAHLKNMKVNWDDEISNTWETESHVPNHQPD